MGPSPEATQIYEQLRAQALVGQGAGGAWLLLVRYGVSQGLSRWERGAADTSNTALAAYVHPDHSDEPGTVSPTPCLHAVPMELIHAMATMVLNLSTEEYFHAR